MTKREVIRTLLARRIPERMGVHEHFWPHIIPNAWGAQGVAEHVDFVARFDLDIRNVSWFWTPLPRPDLAQAVIEETEEWKIGRDGWGATMKHWKGRAGTPEHIDFMLTTPEVWRREFRDAVLAVDVRKSIDLPALRSAYAAAMAGDHFVTFSGAFVFEEMRRSMGDVAMLESLLLEPEFMHDFCSIVTDKNIAHYEMLFGEVGLPDGIHIYEDLGYTRASFISPQLHRQMVLPYHKRLFDLFKSHGLPIILHTCGDFRPHIPAIIESGVDCIQAMEAKTGMDVVELARQYKDQLCFMGNIDVRALESGDRGRIRAEVLGKIEGMRKLRAPYIFMSDHSITRDVKLADYEYALELYRANCRY